MSSGIPFKVNRYLCRGFSLATLLLHTLTAETKPDLLVRVVSNSDSAENKLVRSLGEARNLIRQWRAGGGTGSVIVRVATGEYFLPETLELDSQDSGSAGAPVLYEADGPVRVIGGTKLSLPANWAKGEEIVVPIQVPSGGHPPDSRLGYTRPSFDVFWNDRRLTLARWPKASGSGKPGEGWAYVEAATGSFQLDRFVCSKLPSEITAYLPGAEVHVYSQPEWFDEVVEIAGFDPATKEIRLTRPTKYPVVTGARFYLQNIRAPQGAPGEWWFDAMRSEIHVLAPEDSAANPEVWISHLPTLLKMSSVSHVTFRGFTWEGSTGDALSLENVDGCELVGNQIRRVGGWGVVAKTNGRLTLEGNTVTSTGLGGIKLTGGDRHTLTPARIVARNNTVADVGQAINCYLPAFWLDGVGITIAHNRISHLPHNAVMFFGNNHLITGNLIEDVCRETNDAGAIYTSRDWSFRGTVIEENLFRNIVGVHFVPLGKTGTPYRYTTGWSAYAIYMDDLTENTVIRNNVFKDVDSAAIHLAGGSFHTITGNYFIHTQSALFVSNRNTYQQPLERVRPFLEPGSPYLLAYPELEGREAHNPLTPSFIRCEDNYFIKVPTAYDIRLMSAQNTFARNHFSGSAPAVTAVLKKDSDRVAIKSWSAWQTAGFDTDAVLNDSLSSEAKRKLDEIVAGAGPAAKR